MKLARNVLQTAHLHIHTILARIDIVGFILLTDQSFTNNPIHMLNSMRLTFLNIPRTALLDGREILA